MTVITHSIIIPTKDRPNLLRRALASAFAALGEAGEIIIIDDGSTPAVDRVLDLTHDCLRILRHDTSAGASAARNTGIAHARGEVIFFLDDDDEVMPHYIHTIMAGPAQSHDYGFCCYDKTFADRADIRKGRPRFPTGPIPATAHLGKKIFATSMGVWIKRDAAEKIGAFDTGLTIGEDTDYACRLLRLGMRAWYSAEAGVVIHIHNSLADQGHIGQSHPIAAAAEDMRTIALRFPEFTPYLGQKYLRLCALARLDLQASRYIRSQNSIALRLWFWIFFHIKRLRYG